MSGAYEVGRWYTVPVVRGIWRPYIHLEQRVLWWPVLGPMHGDADHLNFPWLHFHVDYRFINARFARAVADPKLAYRQPLMTTHIVPEWPDGDDHCLSLRLYPHAFREWINRESSECLKDVPRASWFRLARRRCKRHHQPHASIENFGRKLYPSYAGTRIDPARPVCPHKGTPLSSVAPVEGVLTCPLHGLAFCAKTGWALPPKAEAA